MHEKSAKYAQKYARKSPEICLKVKQIGIIYREYARKKYMNTRVNIIFFNSGYSK